MKRFYSILTATLLVGTALSTATAAVEVSVDFFHDNLDAYGDWREVGDYGYCWQPRDMSRDWRPYSDGHWLYTDAGWTWDSEEPFSWAVYHYGRWTRVEQVGWVWVPGTEWGPAWVSWRRSPEYVGWAPLPPEARFDVSIGFNGRVDADFDIGPTNYSFVEVRNFGAPRLRTVLVEPRRNITIINQTTNITKITYVNNVVYNGGPEYEAISRESAQPIRRLKLERREELGGDPRSLRAEQLKSKVEGDSFHVVAPTFDKKPATAPRKVAAKVEKAQVDRGWKDAGPPAEVAKVREKIKSEPATSVEPTSQPKTSKADEPAETPAAPEQTGKGKMRKGDQPPAATAPGATEAPPLATETPLTPNQPPKPGKHAPAEKPIRPEVNGERPVPTPNDKPLPGAKPQKGGKKGDLAEPPPGVQPNESAPGRKPRPENPETLRNPAQPEGDSPREKQPGRKEAQPRPEPPAERKPERPAPPGKPSQARPETRPQPPGGGQPQAPESGKGKGKEKAKENGKEKDDKKPE
jgi:hypothetical protein